MDGGSLGHCAWGWDSVFMKLPIRIMEWGDLPQIAWMRRGGHLDQRGHRPSPGGSGTEVAPDAGLSAPLVVMGGTLAEQ